MKSCSAIVTVAILYRILDELTKPISTQMRTFVEDASRNRRLSRRNASDGLCKSLEILFPGHVKNVLRKAFLRMRETIDHKFFSKASATKTSRKTCKVLPKFDSNQRKTCPEAPLRTEKHQ